MSGDSMICKACGYSGNPTKQVKGSFGVELLLWFFFLLPGIIYSIWRATSAQMVCPKCGNSGMIPIDSPIGRKLIYDQAKTDQIRRQQAMEDPVDKWEREQKRCEVKTP